MAVRNFWIDADIDGRETMLSGGPRGKDGEMRITIYQRDEGGIMEAITINCYANTDGSLLTVVDSHQPRNQMANLTVRTKR